MKPYFKKVNSAVQMIVDGKPYIMLGGELHNSSSSSSEYMEAVWPRLKEYGLNTVIASVSWELIEPRKGEFEFETVKQLLEKAREYNIRLVLIWFATWKNSFSTYIPEWIKTDLVTYKRAVLANGEESRTISCFSNECCEADSFAFQKLMEYLKNEDREHTVIAIQVQNEVGLLSSDRDYSSEANKQFEREIPTELQNYLQVNQGNLSDYLKELIGERNHYADSWKQIFRFGAEEAFMCYYTARYIDRIAEAGKAKLDIPMFVNVWPKQCSEEPAGIHPSGGPISEFHDIYRCAGKHIDAFAPDLYLEIFAEECKNYTRLKDNPLMIPEMRYDRWMPSNILYAIGEYDAICVSPFGIDKLHLIDSNTPVAPMQDVFQTIRRERDMGTMLRQTYDMIKNLIPIITKYNGTGKMRGFLQNRMIKQILDFGKYKLVLSFKDFVDQVDIPSGGIVIQLEENEYIIAGYGCRVEFISMLKECAHTEYISLEEGSFIDGEWKRRRRLNGDELIGELSHEPVILRAKLFSY